MSVKSLDDAKSHCNRDSNCQAFVVFSSNPEKDGKLSRKYLTDFSGFIQSTYTTEFYAVEIPTELFSEEAENMGIRC